MPDAILQALTQTFSSTVHTLLLPAISSKIYCLCKQHVLSTLNYPKCSALPLFFLLLSYFPQPAWSLQNHVTAVGHTTQVLFYTFALSTISDSSYALSCSSLIIRLSWILLSVCTAHRSTSPKSCTVSFIQCSEDNYLIVSTYINEFGVTKELR